MEIVLVHLGNGIEMICIGMSSMISRSKGQCDIGRLTGQESIMLVVNVAEVTLNQRIISLDR